MVEAISRRSQTRDREIFETQPLIGRDVYPLATQVTPAMLQDLTGIDSLFQQYAVYDSLSAKLHANSMLIGKHILGSKRPASAYFTLLDDAVIVEWGEIDPKGNAKLHTYLNGQLNIHERVRQGAVVRSGHTSEIKMPETRQERRIALFDSLQAGSPLKDGSPEFKMVTTLLAQGIIPVSSDGYPIKLTVPVFSVS